MGKELEMRNGDVVDADDAPDCPRDGCDGEVRPRGKVGPTDYWVCECGHRFAKALEDADGA